MNHSNHTIAGTAGGTLFSALMIQAGDIIHTAILAAVGASVSFIVSLVLRRLIEALRRK